MIYQSDRYGFNNPDHEWNKDEIKFNPIYKMDKQV